MANNTVLTAFVIVTALAVVIQACILAAMAFAARKTQQQALAILQEVRGQLTPVLMSTRLILEDAAPKVKKITSNVEHTSDLLRQQTEHLHVALDDLIERSKRHVEHADIIVGDALNTVDQTRASVSTIIGQPLKWAMAVTNGLRAGLDSFLTRRGGGFTAGFGAPHGMHVDAYEPEAEEVFD